MKFKLNKLSHDRKTLYTILGVMVVFVFALSIAYAVLSATLNISGWADIASSSWDIHFANVKVKSGSATTSKPQLTGSTSLYFSTNLANQGDYYEFTVDVVNDGKIDAMVDYIYTSPELDEEQRKYLKYEVTYANGQSIESRQNLRKQSSATIKVRIEYRSDIAESDLVVMPTSLNFYITLVYVQSDGSGVDVPTGGGDEPGIGGSSSVTVVSGDGTQVGDEVCIGEECFYVISSNESTVSMLAKYNLTVDGSQQDDTGANNTCTFSNTDYWGSVPGIEYPYTSGENAGDYPDLNDETTYPLGNATSEVKERLQIYSTNIGFSTRLMTVEEVVDLGGSTGDWSTSNCPSFINAQNFWFGSAYSSDFVWGLLGNNSYLTCDYYDNYYNYGVRPVITISREML